MASIQQIIQWVGAVVGKTLQGLDDLKNGEVYLFALEALFADRLPPNYLLKARLNASSPYDHEHNFSLLREGLSVCGMSHPDRLHVKELAIGQRTAHWPLLVWLDGAGKGVESSSYDMEKRKGEIIKRQDERRKAKLLQPDTTTPTKPKSLSTTTSTTKTRDPDVFLTPQSRPKQLSATPAKTDSLTTPSSAGPARQRSQTTSAHSTTNPTLSSGPGSTTSTTTAMFSAVKVPPLKTPTKPADTPSSASKPPTPQTTPRGTVQTTPRGTPITGTVQTTPRGTPIGVAITSSTTETIPTVSVTQDTPSSRMLSRGRSMSDVQHTRKPVMSTLMRDDEDQPHHQQQHVVAQAPYLKTPSKAGQPRKEITGHTVGVHSFVVAKNMVWCGTGNQTIDTYTAQDGSFVNKLTGHTQLVKALCAVGETVWSGAVDKCVRVWDALTCTLTESPPALAAGVKCLCFGDGHVFAGLSNGNLAIFDAITAKVQNVLKPHSRAINCMVVDPQGRLWTGSDDRTVRVTSLATMQVIATPGSHSSYVTCLEYADNAVFSGSDDQSVRVWDVNTYRPLRRLVAHTRSITCLKAHQGVVYSGSTDGHVYGWNTSTYVRRDIHRGKYGVAGVTCFGDFIWVFYVNRQVVILNIHDLSIRAKLQLDQRRVENASAQTINERAPPAFAVQAPLGASPGLVSVASDMEEEWDSLSENSEMDDLSNQMRGAELLSDVSLNTAATSNLPSTASESAEELSEEAAEEEEEDDGGLRMSLAAFFNTALADVKEVSTRLPIKPNLLLPACQDGVLVSVLLSKFFPRLLDMRVALQGNPILAILAARAAGCEATDIAPENFAKMDSKHLQFIDQVVSFCAYSDITTLLSDSETAHLPEDELLRKWASAQCGSEISDLGADTTDGKVYLTILTKLFPDTPVSTEGDAVTQAVSLAKDAGCGFVPDADTIRKGIPLISGTFLADIFRTHQKKIATQQDNSEKEERAYRTWIRGLGIERPVDDFYRDLSDGIALLQIIDKLKPGTVEWKRVKQRPRNKFESVENLNLAMGYLNEVMKLHTPGISGMNLFEGNRTMTLAVLSQLLKYSIEQGTQGLGLKGDAERQLISWANGLLEKNSFSKINGLRDPSLLTAVPLIQLASLVLPGGSVDLNNIAVADTTQTISQGAHAAVSLSEQVNLSNARYCISALWRSNVAVVATPHDIVSGKSELLLQVFAALRATVKQQAPSS